MKIPERLRPDKIQIVLYIAIFAVYCAYQLHWAPDKPLSELELSECYTQIYVNGRMVGSGFFLEDVKGWHRNYYLVTDHHVYSVAREAEAQSGRGMVLRIRNWWTGGSQYAPLGTDQNIQCGNTDLVCIPILPPLRQRLLFGRAMRFVRMDREWGVDEAAKPRRGGVHLIGNPRWKASGVERNGEILAFHHLNPEDGGHPANAPTNKWENVVAAAGGFIQHLPVLRAAKGGYDPIATFGVFTETLPGDSGGLVFTKKDGAYYAFGIAESVYVMPDGRGNQVAFSTSAIPTDYIGVYLPPPSWKVKYYQPVVLNAILLLGCLYLLWPHGRRAGNKSAPSPMPDTHEG